MDSHCGQTYRLRTYSRSFVGSELIDYMLEMGLCESREEGLAFASGLYSAGVIHHWY